MKLSKFIHVALLVCGVSVAVGQKTVSRYNVTAEGKKVGTAEMTTVIQPDKSCLFKIRMLVGSKDQSAEFQSDFVYDPKGRLLKESHLIASDNVKNVFSTEYSGQTAVTTFYTNGKKTKSSTSKLGNGKSREDPSVFWFVLTKPQPGATSKYWRFEADEDKWKEEITTYVGRSKILLSGKTIEAHKITVDNGIQYVDDKGIIVSLEVKFGDSKLKLEIIR